MASGSRVIEDAAELAVDTCTLNNVFNAIQLAILIALLKWVRGVSRN